MVTHGGEKDIFGKAYAGNEGHTVGIEPTYLDPLTEDAHATAEDLLVEPLIQKQVVEARASVDHQLEDASAGASTYHQKQMAAQQKAEMGDASGPN